MSKTFVRFDGMTWPSAGVPAENLEWALRYGEDTPFSKETRLVLAAYINAFRVLVGSTQRKRDRVVSRLREDALNPNPKEVR